MKRLSVSLGAVSVLAMMPGLAGAAGTYYNNATYQSPQRYGANAGGYYNTYGAGRGYGQTFGQNPSQSMPMRNNTGQTAKKSSANQQVTVNKKGLHLGAFVTHEFANWDFEMKDAGSKLRYDGLAWNVISGEGVYYLDMEIPVQIKAGARYGKQSGNTSMIDDDISNGAYGYVDYAEGRQSGYAMSIGTSDGGSQVGFHAALGLTDYFKWGRVKITPSVGYRYFKHELITKNNSGLTMDVFSGNASHPYVNCISVGSEMQCDPFVLFEFFDSTGTSLGTTVTGRETDEVGSLTDIITAIPAGGAVVSVNLGDTYYYTQVGTSHQYETEWAGPYVAMDMEYVINNTNMVTAGVELGLPKYTSSGDQPYRVDWAHPTSVEDKGGFGDAYHLGLSAMWSTMLTDSTTLSLGMTYDYYNVKNADATTYINQTYYNNVVTGIQDAIDYLTAHSGTAAQIAAYEKQLTAAQAAVDHYNAQGWKIESNDEIKSVYSAMGIRLGIGVKF